MLNKLRTRPRIQSLLIAAAIAVLFIVCGLSAYLTDTTDDYNAPLTMKYGTKFGVGIDSTIFKQNLEDDSEVIITPGSSVDFDPYLLNSGNYDTYVFMQVELPSEYFELEGLDSDEWVEFDPKSHPGLYAYGNKNAMKLLGRVTKNDSPDGSPESEFISTPTPQLCTHIKLAEENNLAEDVYMVRAVGYAIQADKIGASDPASVWKLLQEEADAADDDPSQS